MSSQAKSLGGIQVAIITPFKADGSVDYQSLDTHVNRLIDAGVHGLVPGGSTGEFTALSQAERKAVLEQVVKSAAGRVPVVAGVGTLSTVETVDLAVHASKLGVAALMVVPPFYDAPNYAELREYMADIHKASGVDIMYYNIPSASGVKLTPKELAGLSDVGVKYLKDTSGDGPALTELLFTLEDKVTTFNGWDTLTFYGLVAGAKGSIWGAANIIPELAVELWEALTVKNDLKRGREIWAKVFPVCKFLESNNYGAAVKTAMGLRGWATGPMRKPFALLDAKAQEEVATYLRTAGVEVVKQ